MIRHIYGYNESKKFDLCGLCRTYIQTCNTSKKCDICHTHRHFTCDSCKCTPTGACNMNDIIDKINLRLTVPYTSSCMDLLTLCDFSDDHDGFFFYDTMNFKKGLNPFVINYYFITYIKILQISSNNVKIHGLYLDPVRIVPGLGILYETERWKCRDLKIKSDVDVELKVIMYRIKRFETNNVKDYPISYTRLGPTNW